MAARIGSLYVDLTMNSGPFVTGMNRAQSATSRAAASINRDVGLSQRTVNAFSSSAGNRNFRPYAIIAASRAYETTADRTNLLRGSLLSLTAVAGGFAAALGTNLLSRYADTAVNLNNALKTVTTSNSNLLAVQDELEAVSRRSRSSLQATITLYARTARASETLGLSQEKLLRITETIQKAFSIGGATSAESQGAAIQLSQGIASDRFSGEEFRSVAENAPVLLRGMAESLGVNIGKLREMANAGELTADVVTKAILKASSRIEGEFGQTVITLDRAITHVDNKLLEFIGNTDKSYGVISLLSSGIVSFGDNLDQIIPPLTTIAALVGAIFLSRNKGGLGGGLGALIGGGAGFALGGIEGAISGAALGGLGGFGATRKDAEGLGVFKRMKVDAAEAKQRVVDLTTAQKGLRAELLATGLANQRARRAAEGDLVAQAPASARSAYAREEFQIQKLDERKIALLDEQRDAYKRLAVVTTQITPKAAKLADTQLRAELQLTEALRQQASVMQQVKSIGADARAAGSIEGRAVSESKDDTKARIAAQREFAKVSETIGKQQQSIAERNIRISGLATEADRTAAAERIAIGKQIYAQTDELNKLDQQRTQQTAAFAKVRADAERAGAQVVRENVAQTAQAYRGVSNALRGTTAQLGVASRAATPLGQAMSFVGRQATSLMNLFGGPWGVAITGAALIFAKFAADAQEKAQKIAIAKGIIDEVLQDTPTLPDTGQAGGLLATEIGKIEEQIEQVGAGAAAARDSLDRLLNQENPPSILDPLGQIERTFRTIGAFSIQGQLDQVAALGEQFLKNEITITDFSARMAELQATANSPAFDQAATLVLSYINAIAGAGPAVDLLKQKIIDLQEVANDPINVVINTTFGALDEMPIDAPLQNATNQFATGLGFTRELDTELETLRLIGDARKKAEYTDGQLKAAEKAGVTITDAVRGRIAAFVDEKIALENRDAAVKKSAKDDPYERAIASIQEKTAAQQVENDLIGQTTYAIERARVAQELETAAKEAKITLTPELYTAILQEAEAYAAVAQASEDLRKRRQAEEEQLNLYKSTFSSFFIDIKNSLLEGASLWDTFANAAYNALNKIADRALGLAADGIFDMIFGAITGGLTGGIGGIGGGGLGIGPARYAGGGGLFGLGGFADGGLVTRNFADASGFAGGGFTGIGPKFAPAGVVHRGEYVFDAAAVKRIGVNNLEMMRGYAGGGYVSPSMPSIPSLPNAANSNSVNDSAQIVFSPVTTINAQGSSLNEGQLRAALDQRDRQWREQLPSLVRKIQSQPRRSFA
ncbi:MAG: tape measure protein [Minisyncoccota bacterium]